MEEELSGEFDSNSRPFTPPVSKELSLKDLSGEEKRVAVIGTLESLNRKEITGMLKSGGKKCSLVFTEGEQLEGLKNGTVLRVIGEPNNADGLAIEAEIVQELKDFDSNLFSKVKELEKKHFLKEE